MGGIFNYDNPVMQAVRKLLLLVWLNLLTALLCIPIITAGAAITALHTSAKRLKRDEGALTRCFFSDFTENFKKSTLLWLLVLGVIAFLCVDYYICTQLNIRSIKAAQAVLTVEGVFVGVLLVWLFPLLARYENRKWQTVKNAAILTIAYLPTTFLMLILYLMPVILLLLVPAAFPLVLLFGFSGPVYLNYPLYNRVFERIDAQNEENSE